MNPVVNGILVGITLSLMIGPALFMLMQTSLHRGFRYGFNFAIGICMSDALVLTLVWFGVSQLLGEDPRQNMWFSLVGGIILVLFGAYLFMKPAVPKRKDINCIADNPDVPISIDDSEKTLPEMRQELVKELFPEDKPSKWYVYLLKGFVLNIVNPGVWFIWITAMVTVSSSYQGKARDIVMFFSATLATVFGFDTLKAFVSDRLKNLLKPNFIHRMNQVVGAILVVFGIYLIVNSFYDLESMIDGIIQETSFHLGNEL